MESTKLLGKKRKVRDDIVVMEKASSSSAPAVIDLTSGNFHASLSAGSTSASALNGSLAPKDQEANDDIIDLTVDNPRIPVKQTKSLIYNEVQILETADKGTSMTPKRLQQIAITEGTSSSVKQKAIQNPLAKSNEEVNSPFGNCPICLDSMEEPASTICGHLFCYSCIKQWNKSHKVCPTCRKKIAAKQFHRIYVNSNAI